MRFASHSLLLKLSFHFFQVLNSEVSEVGLSLCVEAFQQTARDVVLSADRWRITKQALMCL